MFFKKCIRVGKWNYEGEHNESWLKNTASYVFTRGGKAFINFELGTPEEPN